MSDLAETNAVEQLSPLDLLDEERYGTKFDGLAFSYIPQKNWDARVAEHVDLHTGGDADIDLITYQVIRHSLWNVNEEHGATVQKVSGSPIAHYATDLQPALLLEDGEYVFGGPFIQLMSGTADLYIRYILENLAANPGIEDGDVFLSDDPWIAGYHQQDHYVIQPVFWEGQIFCWAVGTLHHADCGGSLPGSFCVDATDVFHEPLPLPPFKLVEKGELRTDLEALFARRSRVPDLVRLDLRSQLAGVHVAKQRILGLIRKYGADTVKGSMRRILVEAEQSFVTKLAQIPDGTWKARNYIEAALPDDRNCYKLELTLEKRGEFLVFSNDGTDPQFGAHNCTYAAWRSFIIPAVNACLAADQLYASGGLLRHCVFKPNPGSLVNAVHPGTVGAAIATMTVAAQAANVVSRMLGSSDSLKGDIVTPSGLSGGLWVGMGGTDQWGNPFATIGMDMMAGGLGAGRSRDGLGCSGQFWNPKSSMPNVEATEQAYPQLYLFRRENRGGGAGQFRGGDSIIEAWIPHGPGEIAVSPTGSGIVPPTSLGVGGGLPAHTGSFRILRESNVRETMREGGIPQGFDELDGEVFVTQPKEAAIPISPDDIWEQNVMGGAGYGDPLERDPAAVAEDVRLGQYGGEVARVTHGVVLGEGGDPDPAATDAMRAELRAARLAGASVAGSSTGTKLDAGSERRPLLGAIVWIEHGGDPILACDRCEEVLGAATRPYKDYCAMAESGLDGIGPGFGEHVDLVDDELHWREFYCPSCGVLVEAELAKEGEPRLDDAWLREFGAE